VAYTKQNNSFNEFDRGEFTIRFLRPLWNQLYQLQKQRKIPFINETGLINTASPQLFDSGFFNASSFLQRGKEVTNSHVIELGRKLFSDNRLSGTGARSCASCHSPQKAYTDGLAKNISIDGKQTILRNTPTILYASLQPIQFADGRLSFLEDQAKEVIENHSEMKGDLKKIVQQLSKDISYQSLLQNAYGRKQITETDITKSLAVFIRSQASFNSPFDKYLKGDANAISDVAKKGFTLFMGKAKCGACHFNPLFNGVVPPHFSKMESEIIGVPATNKAPFVIDGDEGKYGFTQAAIHRFAFKTPTLRNIAQTAPYMHNGIYQTLEEVIDFYDKGGGAGIGIDLPNQTLPPDPLNLTSEEKKAIIEFLKSLSDAS
jgi:cytochrome c peroxidase